MSDFSYPAPDPANYAQAEPFPHAVVTSAWDEQLLRECKAEISSFGEWDGEKRFYGARKKHYCGDIDRLPPSVRRVISRASQPRFLRWLEELTGEASLLPDPYLEGGGIHHVAPGGFLKVHADFNWNARLNLYRRLTVLIYLNDNWDESWGGALELWTNDMAHCFKHIYPHNNTMVVFTTDDRSFHGQPHPATSPDGIHRDSIAVYYYSPLKPGRNFTVPRVTTDYRPIEGDSFKPGGGGWRTRTRDRLSNLTRR